MPVERTCETQVAIAVVQHGPWVLIGPRPSDVPLGGMWEFPGGKIHVGELPEAAAVRECREETGLTVAVVSAYPVCTYQYAHGPVRLHFFHCQLAVAEQERGGERCRPPRPTAPFVWVRCDALSEYEFPAANRPILEVLATHS